MKKLISLVLVVSLMIGSLSLATSAKTLAVSKIDLKTARNIATLYLATLETVRPQAEKAPMKLGKDFNLLENRPFYNIDNEVAFYHFNFESTLDNSVKGYIIISRNADLPFVMEQSFGDSPFDDIGVVKTYYISPLVYFNQMADGTYLTEGGMDVTLSDIQNGFKTYSGYRTGLYAQNSSIINTVSEENAAMLSAIKTMKADDSSLRTFFEKINDYLLLILNYFIDSIWHDGDIAQINALVENIIKEHAGEGYTLTYSSVVDKNFMVPQYQSYYQTNTGGGICGKASSMMALAFYRDGRGYSNLPEDETMYAELSAIYDQMTQDFNFFFGNDFVSDEMGLDESYLMLGTLDMGLAYYLYTKGYRAAAQNVVDNARFSITMVPDALSDSLMQALRILLTLWLQKNTNGELAFTTALKTNANSVIVNTLKKGEPVVIGCLTAIGCDWYSNHYFAGVGYYKMECNVPGNNRTLNILSKEYVEVYDTWGHDSSVVDWNVFKSTALYSSTSLANVGTN